MINIITIINITIFAISILAFITSIFLWKKSLRIYSIQLEEIIKYRNLIDNNKINLKLRFEEDEYKCLVRGGIIKFKSDIAGYTIDICLADIGFNQMYEAIHHTIEHPEENYKNLEKSI